MNPSAPAAFSGKQKNFLLHWRWPWHLVFWTGYALFRIWLYYITVTYYPVAFLEYMLLSELGLVAVTYLTLRVYRPLFRKGKYAAYFLAGVAIWILFLWARTAFQFHYLREEAQFQGSRFGDMFVNNITVIVAYFLFLTACKFVKDSYISQQYESARKQEQLMAEVNNLKSQIAPHFLFNTLNNLYGLAVEKSDKLPDLMLRLSNLLRHSLYETQRPQVPLNEEIDVLKSYVELERIRLEDDLELEFENDVPRESRFGIAPLILIVFVENAFKHSKSIQAGPVIIRMKTAIENDRFVMSVENNYNPRRNATTGGIGLLNVRRRLDVLYPDGKHELHICRDESFHTVRLKLQLDNLIAS